MPKLSKKTFIDQMNQLLIFFPNWNVDLASKTVAERWYYQFANCSDREFFKMVQTYIQLEAFNPTVAGLRKYFVSDERKRVEQVEWEKTFRKQEQAIEKERRAHV
ncbi:hypothetical protein SH601_16645 [Gracilibacillus sp. S3-1-1]|uniref:Uncharacterized protein n=1 Tax=Gracilibacillus pellucidus TaxID=3095368 RepID=A0ACC6M9D0_9BACI|nr:hypothetical protein [Gracilibacillus sp. S3-1-1]MDX8047593.1 hypothetical protein [Gracilibacillus sp. S3-1-1]